MRNGRDLVWDERPSLGLGRALTVAVTYSTAMIGCAVLIAMSADHVARMAAPLLLPQNGSPPAQTAVSSQMSSAGASNAAIIAALEARHKQPVTKAASAPGQRMSNARR